MTDKKDLLSPQDQEKLWLEQRLQGANEQGERRLRVYALIEGLERGGDWDRMKTKDVDPLVTAYVVERLKGKAKLQQIREELGLRASRSKGWKLIMQSVGYYLKVDTPGLFAMMFEQNEKISDGVQKLIERLLKQAEDDADDKQWRHATKELPMLIDSLTRLRQATIKMGQDVGVFQTGESARGGQGTTIIIKNNVPLPTKEVVAEHRSKIIEASKVAIQNAEIIHEQKHKT
jgi:hypothetical protein